MPRKMSEESREKKAVYDTEYVKTHQTQRKVVFNNTVPEDVDMLEWVDAQPNINQYIKGLIRDDMNKVGK